MFLLASESSLGFVGEERDALDAVLLHGALGAVREEAVRGVLFLTVEDQTGGLDLVPIRVDLQRAADTGGPEIRLAHDAFGQRDRGDDVRDGEATARLQDAGRLPEDARLV